ncbi:hypothetical protein MLD38_009755 [Melastoma candidum]|uniref:Uncharacterized protein n=1 Tax=Melastoma candidum TaxID=119954 RepID=A0ACB9S033_9MYRT|nr:hypothetical protein MLD38_009755 [Melastoma candidum]
MSRAHNLCYWASGKVAAAAAPRYGMFATWEERAFAEDSGGDLGSIWPPRSYSCSFCGREFRSAQALGGHMNVHRRDRARLKQSQSIQSDEEAQVATDCHDKEGNTPLSLPMSRSDSDQVGVPRVLPGSSLPAKRSAVSDSNRMSPTSPHWAPLVHKQEKNKGSALPGTRPSTYPTAVEAVRDMKDTDHRKKHLCINDARIFARHPQAPSACCIDELSNCKRAKVSESCVLPRFLFDRLFPDEYSHKLEVSRVKAESREEIDLELRLGSPPEVK